MEEQFIHFPVPAEPEFHPEAFAQCVAHSAALALGSVILLPET
jgi:hypothetical protein